MQVITDGSQPNTASFVGAYASGVVATWLAHRDGARPPAISLEPRFWFNPELNSRHFLIPGAIAIIMTLIGTLLTAMVVAREWERGTMEAVMSTPATVLEILLGKLLPYFGLGLIATFGCAMLATHAFGVPMRGSYFALFLLASAFLVPALGQGLLISTTSRNQLVASQLAAQTGFLPAFMLSGFLFEIGNMPGWLQTHHVRDTRALFRRVVADGVPHRRRVGAVHSQHPRDARGRRRILPSRRAQHAQEPGHLTCGSARRSSKSCSSTSAIGQTRLAFVGPPLLQVCLLSFAATLEVRNVDIAVFNDDAGACVARTG